MKRTIVGLLVAALVVIVGCSANKDTAGGPGASNPNSKPPLYGEADNTFNLTAPAINLKQGESKTVTIGIKRGTNFAEDVSLKFTEVPQGMTIEPASPAIKHGETDTKVTLQAATNSALGEFAIHVTGHPTKGTDGSHEFKVTIVKDPAVAAKAQQDEYVSQMQKQLAELDVKYEGLKTSAAKAEGQTKKDLEKKADEAKVKRDVAAKKLDELKEAAPDRWEKIKDSVGNAFDDLKKMFD